MFEVLLSSRMRGNCGKIGKPQNNMPTKYCLQNNEAGACELIGHYT